MPKPPVEQLVAFLRNSEGYVLLRNPDVAANLLRGGDVDLLVEDPLSFARSLMQTMGPPLVYMERSYVHGLFWSWGHVDLLPSLEWHGAVYLEKQEVLANASRNVFGFREASLPHQAVVCWFSSLLWGGFFKERYRNLIVQAARQHEEDLYQALAYAVGPAWGKKLLQAAKDGHPETSVSWTAQLRRILWWRAFRRAPLSTFRGWLSFIWAETRLRLKPPVPWIAVLGLDGSGKTSLLESLKKRRSKGRPFVDVYIGHWRPGFLAKRSEGGPVTNPHAKPPRGVFASCLRLLLLWTDWHLGYWLRLVHYRAKGMLVAFDRHYVDLLADQRRYRYGGPIWLARFVGRLIPKPDLFIILDLPAEVTHARKPEVPLEEARRLRERYLELARSLPNAHIVDASHALEDVVVEVENLILRSLVNKTEKHLGRLGLGG